MLNRILFLLFLVLPNMAEARIILIVGDSLSAAYGIPVEQGWVALLQERLDSRDYPYRIINASISGDTTANARARLSQALVSHEPAVVLLELGGNDGLRGLSLAAMKSNLADMISSVQETGARLLLIGVQLPPNYGPRYTERFQAIYRELAREYDLALLPSLVDGIGTEQNLMQQDGIHPNVSAQPLIRDRVWVELLPLLDQQKPADTHPDFTGYWVLDRTASDDPKEVMKDARGGGARSYSGGRDHSGGMPGGRGGTGRKSGMGYAGSDAGFESGPVADILVDEFEIRHQEPLLTITLKGQRSRAIYTDFRSTSISAMGGVDQRVSLAAWEDAVLVIETSTAGGKRIIQYLQFLDEPRRLERVTELPVRDRQGNPVKVRQVFMLKGHEAG